MRISVLTSLIALAASQVSAQYNITSKPFSLVVHSKTNKKLDGTALGPCHEGAAIEGLCRGGKPSAATKLFHFNTSDFTSDESGYLTYTLKGGNFVVSEPMQLSYNPVSNVAVPLFTPEESGTLVQFDKSGKLFISGYVDDTVNPLKTNKVKNYYRWYMCNTYAGYLYNTLAWTLGDGKPQNPSCQKVDVVRVF